MIEKNGVQYPELRRFILNLLPGKIEFKFDNLFGGNEILGNEMNRVLNDNWRIVWEDVKRSYEEAVEIILQDISNKILEKVPFGHYFL